MDVQQLKTIIEAAILAAGEPVSLERLQGLFDEDARPVPEDFRAALAALGEDCATRGIELVEVGSGWRFQSRRELMPWVARLWEEKPQRYSRAFLETLALIAYRQPITRADIEDIRGVAVGTNIVKSLTERGWVRVVGHRDVPGRPALYATTRAFLDYFNLKSLDDLPTLAELRDIDKLETELDLGDDAPAPVVSIPPPDAEPVELC
ncbi:MAG: SMC-Scp complex subunit ScpB [Thiohalomonadaceae bacterium]